MAAPVCVLLSALVMFAEANYGADLAWKKTAILQGEYWRLLTGHWLHLGWVHWAMNQLGLMLILWLFPQLLMKGRWVTGVVMIGLGVAGGLMFTELGGYVGMSGVLYGLVFYGCMIDNTLPFKIKCLVLAGVISKVVVEQLWPEVNAATAEQIGGMVAIDAHLFGSLSGFALGGLAWFKQHRTEAAPKPVT